MIVILDNKDSANASVKTDNNQKNNSNSHIAESLHIAYNHVIRNRGGVEQLQKALQSYLDNIKIVKIKKLKQLQNDLDTVERETRFLRDMLPSADYAFNKFKLLQYVDSIGSISSTDQKIVSKIINELLLTGDTDMLDDNLIDKIEAALSNQYIMNKVKLLDDIVEGRSDYRFVKIYEKIRAPERALEYCIKAEINPGDIAAKTIAFYRKENILTNNKLILSELSKAYVPGFLQYIVELVHNEIISISQAATLLYSEYLHEIVSKHVEFSIDPAFFMLVAEHVVSMDSPLQKYTKTDLTRLSQIILLNSDNYISKLDDYLQVYEKLANIVGIEEEIHMANAYGLIVKNIDIKFRDMARKYVLLHTNPSKRTVRRGKQIIDMSSYEIENLVERCNAGLSGSLSVIESRTVNSGIETLKTASRIKGYMDWLHQQSQSDNLAIVQESIKDVFPRLSEFANIDHDNYSLAGDSRSAHLKEILKITLGSLCALRYTVKHSPDKEDLTPLFNDFKKSIIILLSGIKEDGRDIYRIKSLTLIPLVKFLDVYKTTITPKANCENALKLQGFIKNDLFEILSQRQPVIASVSEKKEVVKLIFIFSTTSFICMLFDLLYTDKLSKDFYDKELSSNGVVIVKKVLADLKRIIEDREYLNVIAEHESMIELISNLVRLFSIKDSVVKVLQSKKNWETMINFIDNCVYNKSIVSRLNSLKIWLLDDKSPLNMEEHHKMLCAGEYEENLMFLSKSDQVALEKNFPETVRMYRLFIKAIDNYVARVEAYQMGQPSSSMQSENLTGSSSASASTTRARKDKKRSGASRIRR